jgi:hypothetical protein
MASEAELIVRTLDKQHGGRRSRHGRLRGAGATNAELEPRGLYLTHIWGPEQQILTPEWRSACRLVSLDPPLSRLRVEVLGPLDLITSKLARGDDADLDDVEHLLRVEHLGAPTVLEAVRRAVVPEVLRDVFEGALTRLEARLAALP